MEQIVFSIEDFKSGAYYFNIPMKLQEFLLSMVPVVNPDEPRHQITMFLVIFLISIVCVTRTWPFKAPLLSAVMVAIYSLILLVLTGAKDILPEATLAVQIESAKTMFAFAMLAFVTMLSFVFNCFVNLLVGKKLFVTTMMRGEPHYEAIKNMWATAKDLDPDDLVKCVHHWEIFHATKLETILPVLWNAINSDGRTSKPVLSPRSFSAKNEKARKTDGVEQAGSANDAVQDDEGTDAPNYSVSV